MRKIQSKRMIALLISLTLTTNAACAIYEEPIEEPEKKKIEIEHLTQQERNALLMEIQETYEFEANVTPSSRFGLPKPYTKNKNYLKAKDLEEVYLYKDTEGRVFFMPVNMVNYEDDRPKLIYGDLHIYAMLDQDDKMKMYLFGYGVYNQDVVLSRLIYPELDDSTYLYVEEVSDDLADMICLGKASAKLPYEFPKEYFRLSENEYTDAIMNYIHDYFKEHNKQGEYDVYFGEYRLNGQNEYKIRMDVAIVGEDKKYYWGFRAMDELDENGQVVIQPFRGAKNYSPASYDVYAGAFRELIDDILSAERLVLPLTVEM